MTMIRSLICSVLLLSMVLTSAAMSVARGSQDVASGTMVLCTGTGPISVQVDSDGQPIGPVHFCPDCALAFFATTPDPQDCAFVPVARHLLVQIPKASLLVRQRGQTLPKARAPPAV
jgi:hypothetical protein